MYNSVVKKEFRLFLICSSGTVLEWTLHINPGSSSIQTSQTTLYATFHLNKHLPYLNLSAIIQPQPPHTNLVCQNPKPQPCLNSYDPASCAHAHAQYIFTTYQDLNNPYVAPHARKSYNPPSSTAPTQLTPPPHVPAPTPSRKNSNKCTLKPRTNLR